MFANLQFAMKSDAGDSGEGSAGAVLQQVSGLAFQGDAQLRQRLRINTLGDGITHQVVDSLACEPRPGSEGVAREPCPLRGVRELPAYRHGGKVALTSTLDNRQRSVYVTVTRQRSHAMTATTIRTAKISARAMRNMTELAYRINEQRDWIAEHGTTLAGYVERYGSATDDEPKRYGMGGEAIYKADTDALAEMER